MPTENVAPTDASHAAGQIPTAPMVDSRALGPNLVDTLWIVIGRFDLYMTSVNAKAALIATFNTFVLTAVVLKWQQIIGQFKYYASTTRLAAVLVSVIAIAAVASLWFTFRALGPYLESHKAPGRYHSLIFFEHVAEHADGQAYYDAIVGASSRSLIVDLCHQAHALSRGARGKFSTLRSALQCIAFAELPAMALLIALKLVLLLFAA